MLRSSLRLSVAVPTLRAGPRGLPRRIPLRGPLLPLPALRAAEVPCPILVLLRRRNTGGGGGWGSRSSRPRVGRCFCPYRGFPPRSMPSESDVLRRRARREEVEAVRRDEIVRAGLAKDLPLACGHDVEVEEGPPEGGFGVHPDSLQLHSLVRAAARSASAFSARSLKPLSSFKKSATFPAFNSSSSFTRSSSAAFSDLRARASWQHAWSGRP